MEGFGERLREARGCESQASFAKKLGLTQVAYSRYELNQREPNLDCLYQIGIITGVSADWLLGLPDRGGSTRASATGRGAVAVVGSHATIATGGDCSKCKLLQDHIKAITGRV